MVNPDFIDDEEFVEKARIYHRYRITGFQSTTENSLSAVQKALPLVSPELEQELVDQLISSTGDELDVLRQDRLRTVASQEAAELVSSLTHVKLVRYQGFDEYVARHEASAKLVVRLFHTDIRDPKIVHQFRAFRIVASSGDTYLFNAPGSLVDAFLRRLASLRKPQLDIWYPELDLQGLAKQGSTQIRGASFRISNRPNLKTAMVFGPDVNEDDAWEEYSRVGNLTYVQMQLTLATEEMVKLMVTRRGSLLPYGIDDVNRELALCTEVYDKYLLPFQTGEVHLNKRRKR